MPVTPLPTLRQLQFFMALVRRESFSKAAADCYASQSTLSSAIKEMETLLDQQLVDRTTRTFALTPSGMEIAARAPAILAAFEDLAVAVSTRGPLEGEFHLGVIPTIAPFLMPAMTTRLRRKFPKLKLLLREEQTEQLVERLSAGLIDAAILALPYDLPGIDTIEVGVDPFVFVCNKEHALASRKSIAPPALDDQQLLLLEDGHCLRDHAIDACGLTDYKNGGTYSATSLLTLTQMTRAGIGATLLPQMAIKAGLAKIADLVTVPFSKPAPQRRIGVAWRRGSGRSDDAAAIGALASACL